MTKRTRSPNGMPLVRGEALAGLLIGLMLLAPKSAARADLGTDSTWVGPGPMNTQDVVWGDWDKDDDLSLRNNRYPGEGRQVYGNDEGNDSLVWKFTGDEKNTRNIVWGNRDGDDNLGFVVGSDDQNNRLHHGYGGKLAASSACLSIGNGYQHNYVYSTRLVLYDQTDVPGSNGFPSQEFEAASANYDCQGADDFVVPTTEGFWVIEAVEVLGSYSFDGGPTPFVDLYFYADASGQPGAVVYSAEEIVPSSDVAGDLTVDLPTPTVLLPGTYWVSVQADMDFDPNGQWFWSTRAVQSNSPYAWQNPGDGFGTGCTIWTPGASTCGVGGGLDPDALFQLFGTVGTTRLTASKTVNREKIAPEMITVYSVTIQNIGAVSATNVTMGDVIPAGTSYVLGSLCTHGGPPAVINEGVITWTGTIFDAQTITFTYQVNVISATGYITNTATVSHTSLAHSLSPTAVSQVFDNQDYLYTNEIDVSIPDNGCPAAVSVPIDVTDSFVVGDVRVGVNLNSTYRGDISATLQSPSGIRVQLFEHSGDPYDNYDVLFTDASTNPVDDSSNDDTGIPFYNRDVAPADPLSAFDGENAFGTWILLICDGAGDDLAMLNQWSLFFLDRAHMPPAIEIRKTVGTDPSGCAATDAIMVTTGTDVSYCYEAINTGPVTFTVHNLVDNELGTILSGLGYALIPGASITVIRPAVITQTTTNLATWTATLSSSASVTVSDSASVTVQSIDVPLVVEWSSIELGFTTSVAWGDYDGDGDLDLAVGNSGDVGEQPNPNQVYRNDGGTLTLFWTSDEVDSTASVAWGDYDSDGDIDLAVGNDGENRIYQNNNGVLTTNATWSSAETDESSSIAWGDYDDDNDLDLAVGNSGDPNRVYCNDNGALTLCWSSGQVDYTSSVEWADYDTDGDLDLAVGNIGGFNWVYCNDNGILTLCWSSSGADDTTSVAWGDYDGDGDLDLAVGNLYQSNLLYRNDGGELTTSAVWSSAEADRTLSIAWADYDADGDLDLTAGNYWSHPSRLYRNDGGVLTTSAVWSANEMEWTTSVAWGDYDGDGVLDLAAGNEGQPNRIYRNDSSALTANPVWSSNKGDDTTSVAWGDFDGDGDLDLAVGNENSVTGQPNQLYRNDSGMLTHNAVWSSDEADHTWSIAWGDYDNDGDLDLAVGNWGPNRLYRNDGGMLSTSAVWSSDEADETNSVAWGDCDGDGDLDLAVGNGGDSGQSDRVYCNNDEVLVPCWSSTETDDTTSVAWGDYDGDGDLDLAVGNDRHNHIYRNDGGMLTASAVWSSDETDITFDVAWGDYDNDGSLDLAVGNYWNQPNRLYHNDGGALTTSAIWSSYEADYTVSIAWGDYDGDGDLDLAVGNRTNASGQPNRVYRNDGGMLTTGAVWSSIDAEWTNSVMWGDYDGDGDLDLATGNWFGENNHVYQNLRRNRVSQTNNPPRVTVPRPGVTDDAYLFSTPHIITQSNIAITYTLFDPEGNAVTTIFPEFSSSGEGQWLPATGMITRNLATGHYLREAATETKLPLPLVDGTTVSATLFITKAYEIADLDIWINITHTQNADLEVVLISPSGITATLFRSGSLTGTHLIGTVFDDEAVTPVVLGTPPYTYGHQPLDSLARFDGRISAGEWILHVSDSVGSGTGVLPSGALVSWGLTIETPPAEHVFYWNAEADLIKSDNVVFRIRAQPGYDRSPILWSAVDGKSTLFRVEASWFIKVVDDIGNSVTGATVYADGIPITRTVTGSTVTDRAGLLNPGALELGTELVALAQRAEQSTTRASHEGWAYRTYLTSLNLDDVGVPRPHVVAQPGEQLLILREDSPLILFNIVVSVEWDADEAYLDIIEDAFRKASEYLYDVTDGQMAFGQISIYDKAQYWSHADFQISTKNTVRPYAFIGGITSDDTAHSIRVGRFWNGSSGNQGDWNQPNGYRTLIHEFGHYALYLYDEYFVRLLDAEGHFIGQAPAACTGLDVIGNNTDDTNASLMYYQYNASELADSDRWTINCQNTEQARINGEPDWQTVLARYGNSEWELNTPSSRGSVMAGPDAFPIHLLPFPIIEVHDAGTGGTARQLMVLGQDGNPFPNALVALYTTPYSYTVAIDQGLTDQDGQLTIYGALEGDTIQAASFDGAYAGAVTVDTDTTYTLTLSSTGSGALAAQTGRFARYLGPILNSEENIIQSIPFDTAFCRVASDPQTNSPLGITDPRTLATQDSGFSPYLNLIPGSEGDTLRLEVHRAPAGSLSLNAVVIPGEGGGSPQSAPLVYSPAEDAYVGQVSFAGVGLGSGEARVSGLASGQSVSINSDYNLMRVLDGQANDLASEDGNFQLHIDDGSLLNHADAYAVVLPTGYVPGPMPEGMQVVGSAYEVRFSGAATGLTKPGILTMYYHPEVMGGSSGLMIYRWNAVTEEWQRVGGEQIELNNAVAVTVEQLGIYVLMGQRFRVYLPVVLRR